MAKLLFITQKVDKDDDLLGIYHRWLEELAKRIPQISVICLYRGRVELPSNVAVYSLGKEIGRSRIKYFINFYKYLFRLKKQYDVVFVHMNPEYVVLGSVVWKLFRKRLLFWYNHPLGGLRARLAIAFADSVFYTSPAAFTARYKKARPMPVGIDVDMFRRLEGTAKKRNSILYIGRISPIKKLEVLLGAAEILKSEGVNFTITIIGNPSKASEFKYAEEMKNRTQPLIDQKMIVFLGAVPNYKTPELYNTHEISVNMTPSGSLDKAIIESMACELPVIVSNRAFLEIFPAALVRRQMFVEGDAEDLAFKIRDFLSLPTEKRRQIGREMRQLIVRKHSLTELSQKLIKLINA